MKIALRTCWVNAPSARLHRLHQRESAAAIHLDDPDRLLDVVCTGELERAQRRLDVDGFHRVAQAGSVTGNVAEGQLRPLGRIRQDVDGGVSLSGELVRVRVVLVLVGADEPGVRGERIVDVPGAAALGALATGPGCLRDRRGVEAVATKELPGESLRARLDHDPGRDVAQAGD